MFSTLRRVNENIYGISYFIKREEMIAMRFKEKYGQWAFVAGGSDGMGGEYSTYLAKQGMNVIVNGREKVEEKCKELEETYGIKTLAVPVNLGNLDAVDEIKKATEGLDIGFFVYNAGFVGFSEFHKRDLEQEMYRLNVNVRSLLGLSLVFSKQMVAKRKGGIILMSSCGGVVGTPYINTYSATKAYIYTLAEAMWAELQDYGIDVLSVLPGNTIGQNFSDVPTGTPGFQTGKEVVEEAFSHLGKCVNFIAGEHNRMLCGKYFDTDLRREGIMVMKKSFEEMMQAMGIEK